MKTKGGMHVNVKDAKLDRAFNFRTRRKISLSPRGEEKKEGGKEVVGRNKATGKNGDGLTYSVGKSGGNQGCP